MAAFGADRSRSGPLAGLLVEALARGATQAAARAAPAQHVPLAQIPDAIHTGNELEPVRASFEKFAVPTGSQRFRASERIAMGRNYTGTLP